MDQFDEFVQSIASYGYEKLVNISVQACAQLLPICKRINPDNSALLLLSIILSAVGADGQLAEKEKQFMVKVMSTTEEKAADYFKLYGEKTNSVVESFAKYLDADKKNTLVCLLIAISAIDGEVSREENAWIRKINAIK